MASSPAHADDDRVSVVIPLYNAERYVTETLESVFAQTYSAIEVIVVDDGSTDGSLDIVRGFGSQVRLLSQENKGPAAARNMGIRGATGRWVAFVDADDVWAPDKIERQIRLADRCVWSHTDAVFRGGVNNGRRHSEFGGKFGGEVLATLVRGNFICTSTVMARRDVLLEMNGFDERLTSIQDWDLWTRIARRHPIGYVDEPLVRYRVHPVSISRRTRRTLPNHLAVIAKIFGAEGPGAGMPNLRRLALANSYGICSQIAVEEGDIAFALRCGVMATVFEPLSLWRWRHLAGCSARAAGLRH